MAPLAVRLIVPRLSPRASSLGACEQRIISGSPFCTQRRWSSKKGGDNATLHDTLRGLASSQDTDRLQSKRGKSPNRRIQEHRKKTTMDEFFANLGTTSNSKPPRRRSGKQPDQERTGSTLVSSVAQEESTTGKVNMSSFFDEVNKIVAKNKEESERAATVKDATASGQEWPLRDGSSSTSSPSISDLLPQNRIRGPDAYDEDAFDQYSDILDTILTNPGFRRTRSQVGLDDQKLASVEEWLRAEEPVVNCSLPTLESFLDTNNPVELDEDTARRALREDLRVQQSGFLEHHLWNRTQYELAIKALLRLGNFCAKKATGPPAEIAWEKLKEAGFQMNKEMLQNYLYVTSTFSSWSSPRLPLKGGSILDFLDEVSDEKSYEIPEASKEEGPDEILGKNVEVATEVALCHDILFGASEQTTLTLVRRLVLQGKAAAAERLLESSASDELRLRTYDPVFQCYLEHNDVSSALKLYTKMKSDETVHLRPETYIQLMSGIAENGFFQSHSPPIDGAELLGYDPPCGPKMFDRLAEELAGDALEISAAAAKRLYNALIKGFDCRTRKPLHVLQSMEVCNEPAEPSELVASRVSLDTSTGQCPRTGVRLRLINLDDQQKERLKEGLHYLASTAYNERTGKNSSAAEDNLREFGDWLARRSDKPFTAIVDGPNIGYYFQNFEQGSFNFYQIQFVVDALENMGENVLVVLPKKYTHNSFMLTKATGKKRQTLTQAEREICDRLVSSRKAYIVPPSFLDDYYWMYASVCGQGEKWTSEEQYIPPNNAEGRWPGIRPMLISNDKMRDHKLSLLEPRPFRRWYSNFLVNFTFSAFVGDQCVDKEIGFSTADFYSREIQGNKVQGHSGDDLGTVWHFPVSDWGENESFCVRIPRK